MDILRSALEALPLGFVGEWHDHDQRHSRLLYICRWFQLSCGVDCQFQAIKQQAP